MFDNDNTEYTEFFKIINADYLNDRQFTVNKTKKYVLCLTNEWCNKRFWKEYADKHRGICVGFKLILKTDSPQFKKNGINGIWYRDVYYDSGNEFEFLKKLRCEFKKEFGKELFLSGAHKFSLFYKRNKFSWEKETRLLINTENTSCEFCSKCFYCPTYKDNIGNEEANEINEKKYCLFRRFSRHTIRLYYRLKTDNCLFKLQITEIIIGKNVNKDTEQKINIICSKKGIKILEDTV